MDQEPWLLPQFNAQVCEGAESQFRGNEEASRGIEFHSIHSGVTFSSSRLKGWVIALWLSHPLLCHFFSFHIHFCRGLQGISNMTRNSEVLLGSCLALS